MPLQQVIEVAAFIVLISGCGNRVVFVDPPDGGDSVDSALRDSAPARTCDAVGKGVGTESCCEAGFCGGLCTEFGICLCPGTSIACPDGTVCCPSLGCTSSIACADYLVRDGGRD